MSRKRYLCCQLEEEYYQKLEELHQKYKHSKTTIIKLLIDKAWHKMKEGKNPFLE